MVDKPKNRGNDQACKLRYRRHSHASDLFTCGGNNRYISFGLFAVTSSFVSLIRHERDSCANRKK